MNQVVSAIVAMAENRVIGKNNQLPWHLPADLQHFKRITSGHTIVMGRKTYESIGRPLPKRRNIILTRNADYTVPGCEVVHTMDEVLALGEDVFIIGGAQVYALAWPYLQRLYLTIVRAELEGDARFPAIDWREWHESERMDCLADDKNAFNYSFLTLDRC